MQILAHRGYWKTKEEKNSSKALYKALEMGFGIETDIRDYQEEIIVYHDIPPSSLKPFYLQELLEKSQPYNSFLALNIKSDGLGDLLKEKLKKLRNYFLFDMSLPEMVKYQQTSLKVFTFQNEFVQNPPLLEESSGIWLDCFQSLWYNNSLIENHLKNNLKISLVSPELHSRDPRPFWDLLKKSNFLESENLLICTDLPNETKKYLEY